MGIKGISLSETVDFVSKYDKEEPKTTWKLGVLDADMFASLGELTNNPLKMMLEIVRFGLKGIENFKDASGNEIKFSAVSRAVGPYSYKIVSDNIIKIIPSPIISELGAEILKISKLNEEEAKN